MSDRAHAAPDGGGADTSATPAGWGQPSWQGVDADSAAGPPRTNQPGWQPYPYPAARPPKSRFGVGVLVGIGIGLAISVIGVIALVVLVDSTDPEYLGDDVAANAHYGECGSGVMSACDALYWETAVDSEMEEFGATCGGRTATWQYGGCVSLNLQPQ